MLGGTGQSLKIEDCMCEKTSERARKLDQLLNVKYPTLLHALRHQMGDLLPNLALCDAEPVRH